MLDRAKRAGCWAVGTLLLALFFVIGTLISLMNGDLLTTIQGGALAAVGVGLALYLSQRHQRKR
jgi:hypothetical protein